MYGQYGYNSNNMPSMSSLPNHRQMSQGQQQQQQQQQAGYLPIMMPNYPNMMSPFYVMDQNNQIHFMNPQLMQMHHVQQQALLMQQIQAQRQIQQQQLEQQQRILLAQQEQLQQARLQAGHGHSFKNLRINPLYAHDEGLPHLIDQRTGIPISTISTTNATASSKQTDSGFQSGGSSLNEAGQAGSPFVIPPPVDSGPHALHHQQQRQLIQQREEQQIQDQQNQSILALCKTSTMLPINVPKVSFRRRFSPGARNRLKGISSESQLDNSILPMNPKAPTNDPSELLPDHTEHPTETQSMIIEAGSDAVRLDVEVDTKGRAVKASINQVEPWIKSGKETVKLKEGEDENDGYKTEDEVVIQYPTITRKPDRIVTHDNLNKKVAELSKSCISANDVSHVTNMNSVSSLNRTRTRGKLNRSVSHSLSQRRYKHNPGGQKRQRPVAPESEPVTEDAMIQTPPIPCAPQPTPVDPISESELPSNSAGQTPHRVRRQSLAPDQDREKEKQLALFEGDGIEKAITNFIRLSPFEIRRIESVVRLKEVENRRTKHKHKSLGPKKPPRGRAQTKSIIKTTSADVIQRSREANSRKSLQMAPKAEVSYNSSLISSSSKPQLPATGPSLVANTTRQIVCDKANNLHVSLLQTNSREEPSSDGKTKKSLSKRLKIFSTGWKAKQRKAEIAADSNERLRDSGRNMLDAFNDDPAIVQAKKATSTSKLVVDYPTHNPRG